MYSMKLAFISDNYIVPFDSVEFAEVDTVKNYGDTKETELCNITMRESKSILTLSGDDVNQFWVAYSSYLHGMSKLIQEDENE